MTTSWLTIPAPLEWLFRKVPLKVYPPNALPARCSALTHRETPSLWVFTSDDAALQGLPSYNPSCLKWQTFLKLSGITFRLVSSNNHASPTGALPFLLPPSAATNLPIPSGKLEQYAREHGHVAEPPPGDAFRIDAYESLLDHRIRNAWLYTLYLSPTNASILDKLYVAPVSTSTLVRFNVRYHLRQAAESEILKSTGKQFIDPAILYADAKEAFSALDTLLGDGTWFFGAKDPGLFDSTVFSYTHLILDENLAWQNDRLGDMLREFPRLVSHRNKLYDYCWGS
ncbi:hypothetical protein GGR57DRAFT_506496 [Xylariaceae sp. FL1272]|nr:hypothetical protein GGR57DRAFT_506496 [Xylariaceae sp. FL1272]